MYMYAIYYSSRVHKQVHVAGKSGAKSSTDVPRVFNASYMYSSVVEKGRYRHFLLYT